MSIVPLFDSTRGLRLSNRRLSFYGEMRLRQWRRGGPSGHRWSQVQSHAYCFGLTSALCPEGEGERDEGAKMRIGAVSYLNTKPLVYGLAELAPQHELVFDLPSRLADDLAAGRLDVALIPSIEYLQHSDYTIISDACIACR